MDKPRFSTHHSQCEPQAIRDALVEVDCEDCGLDPICMVLDYAEEASGVPEGVLVRRHPVERGKQFFVRKILSIPFLRSNPARLRPLWSMQDGRGR